MPPPANLISVRSDVAASLLIDGLFDEAVGRLEDPLPSDIETALATAEDPRIARLGYLARVVELERFEVARAPDTWLVDWVAGQPEATIADLAVVLAAQEPLEKTAPVDGAPLWKAPGPGGHVRHFLAVRACGSGPPERKRSWCVGFFVRCCDDASAAG